MSILTWPSKQGGMNNMGAGYFFCDIDYGSQIFVKVFSKSMTTTVARLSSMTHVQ